MGEEGDVFKNIFSSLNEGLLLVSPELKVLKANPAAEEIFWQSQDVFFEKTLTDFFPNQPKVFQKIKETLTLGSSFRDIECQAFRKADAMSFPTHLTISPYLDGQGMIRGAVLSIKDIRLLKYLEDISRPIDQMSTLGDMALGLAHEIKNPLVSIRGSAQLLRDELSDPGKKEYLEIVVKEADRINRMIAQILSLSGPQKLEIQPINIHKILEDIIILEQPGLKPQGPVFIQDYDPSLPPILGDADKMKQVFINIIQNAIEASPERSFIFLKTRISSQFFPKTPRNSQKFILVEIIDQGSEIDSHNQAQWFTPFFTTKKGGTGLGLPLSVKIIEEHGGKLKIKSSEKTGTTAQILLPFEQGTV